VCLDLPGPPAGAGHRLLAPTFKETDYPTVRPPSAARPRPPQERADPHQPHPPDRRRRGAVGPRADVAGPGEGAGGRPGPGGADLDVGEVAAGEGPPVCKILDYGKMRFESSQKGNKAGKVRQQKLKEVRLRPKTGGHDADTKAAQARKFLEHNDKVQVTVLF